MEIVAEMLLWKNRNWKSFAQKIAEKNVEIVCVEMEMKWKWKWKPKNICGYVA